MPKSVKHQSFKLTPHKHAKDKVIMYIVVAALVGIALGWLLKDHIVSSIGMISY